MDTSVGARLARLRKNSGKSQQMVADFCGISQPALSRYESGERWPDARALMALAGYYGVGVEHILGAEPPPAKNGPQMGAAAG